MGKPHYLQWDTPVQYIKGVGPKLAAILSRRSIQTVRDLIDWLPRTWQDNRLVGKPGRCNYRAACYCQKPGASKKHHSFAIAQKKYV